MFSKVERVLEHLIPTTIKRLTAVPPDRYPHASAAVLSRVPVARLRLSLAGAGAAVVVTPCSSSAIRSAS